MCPWGSALFSPPPAPREKSAEKVQSISGQQFAQTVRTPLRAGGLYLFSVLFCTEPYGHRTGNMHRPRHRHSVPSPYSSSREFSVLKHGIFSGDGCGKLHVAFRRADAVLSFKGLYRRFHPAAGSTAAGAEPVRQSRGPSAQQGGCRAV